MDIDLNTFTIKFGDHQSLHVAISFLLYKEEQVQYLEFAHPEQTEDIARAKDNAKAMRLILLNYIKDCNDAFEAHGITDKMLPIFKMPE